VTRFLVTGAQGCIGAWVVHELVRAGSDVVTFDLSPEPRRLRLLLADDEIASVPQVTGDISDLATVERAIDDHGITNVIHLAALQVPFCRADPPLGARVNVVGTVNVFEAAKTRELAPIVYASSIAVFDSDGTLEGPPATIYGVYKRANEQTAAVYHSESGVASVGLRPHTVYGVGRDQGLTSAPTAAMLAAAAGRPYTIPYGGAAQMQLARDVARAFLAASTAGVEGAEVHNLRGHVVSVAEIVAATGSASITHEEARLPFPVRVDSATFDALLPDFVDTPFADGVRETIDRFRTLLQEGKVAA
jgi:UDP-glucuronate 4-epimerase